MTLNCHSTPRTALYTCKQTFQNNADGPIPCAARSTRTNGEAVVEAEDLEGVVSSFAYVKRTPHPLADRSRHRKAYSLPPSAFDPSAPLLKIHFIPEDSTANLPAHLIRRRRSKYPARPLGCCLYLISRESSRGESEETLVLIDYGLDWRRRYSLKQITTRINTWLCGAVAPAYLLCDVI